MEGLCIVLHGSRAETVGLYLSHVPAGIQTFLAFIINLKLKTDNLLVGKIVEVQITCFICNSTRCFLVHGLWGTSQLESAYQVILWILALGLNSKLKFNMSKEESKCCNVRDVVIVKRKILQHHTQCALSCCVAENSLLRSSHQAAPHGNFRSTGETFKKLKFGAICGLTTNYCFIKAP